MLITLIYWLLVAGIVAFIYYSHWVEPRRLRLSRLKVGVPRLPAELEGLKVLHISDLHVKSAAKQFPQEIAQQAVEMVLSRQPDIVCVTGDLGQASRHIELAADRLRPLAQVPTYAVMGNHDHDKMLESEFAGPPEARIEMPEWRAIVERAGLKVLHNQHQPLEIRGHPVVIAGAGDASCGYDDLPATLSEGPRGALHLLLSHSPDIMDCPESDWADLVLCGHTHGGQAKLPLIGTPWAPVWRDRRRSEGLFRVGEAICFVSRGVCAGIRTRFLCPPEVCEITLTSGAGDRVRQLPRQRRLKAELAAAEQPCEQQEA
jgi:predicted MPP superfamily phosphohydrolase